MPSSDRQTGIVKFFNTQKGFGFITPDDQSPEIFVHSSEIQGQGFKNLSEGQPVQYEVSYDQSKGKNRAIQVTNPDGTQIEGSADYGGNSGYGGGYGGNSGYGGNGGGRGGRGYDRQNRYGNSGGGRRNNRNNYDDPPVGEQQQGTVKFFNEEKGFGFITPDTGGQDVFVHATDISGDRNYLEEGNTVEFINTFDSRTQKNRAKNVTCLDVDPKAGGGGDGYGGVGVGVGGGGYGY